MTQHEFDRLSEKYLAGQCTEEEMMLLKKWADFHYEEQSNESLFAFGNEEITPKERIWRAVTNSAGIPQRRRVLWRRLAGVAAAVLLSGSFVFYVLTDRQVAPEEAAVILPFATPVVQSSKVTLPDGSFVFLEQGADIVADKDFGVGNRKVWLKGEAFFDVKPNPNLPFTVYAGELVTEVLGTSFRIAPKPAQKKIEVSVVTGKVSVYTAQTENQRKRDGVIAMPNQRVSYDLERKSLKQDVVDVPVPVSKAEASRDFDFDESPVSEVLARISEVYGIQVIAGTPDLKRCIFTGDLNDLDMFRKLDFLCEVVGATYELRGAAVFVTGKGCSEELK